MTDLTKKNWYINGHKSDIAFIILCPLIALVIVSLVCGPRGDNYVYSTLTPVWFAVAASVLTHAHVLLVFTRSHMNMSVFKRYKYRFTLVPLLLLVSMWVSNPMFLLMGFVGVYWDEWHSIMQTFGFGRIYDGKAGNPPLAGRKLDMGMAFVMGLLPHLVLLTYLPKTQVNGAFEEYLSVPLTIVKQYSWLVTGARIPMIVFGILYAAFYIISYRKLIKNGYQYSKAKFALFAVTGLTTITVASVYTIADGVFFGNIYHALQYIFIVMVTERSNLSEIVVKKTAVTPVNKDYRIGLLIFFLLIVPLIFILAGFRQITESWKYLAAFWLMTSIMHFWFDGFIWSVRRQDIN
ncbi:MAG: hypothetical protein H7177_12875 [Rhizobacter sp.]|nr:hypothetical protein [Bacteriovorax sp.]